MSSHSQVNPYPSEIALSLAKAPLNPITEVDGLETRYAYKYVEANGTETSKTADITWTKDADGKPVSYTIVSSQNGADTVTGTGDVKTDESGLISWVGNVKTGGKALPTTATIGYAKIDNPLPNAYEGWKSFMLSDVIL